MIDYKDFGYRVRLLREKRQMTQEQLAEQVDVTADFLQHIERGSRAASLDTLAALCLTLDTDPNFLLASLKANHTDAQRQVTREDPLQTVTAIRNACDLLESFLRMDRKS